MTPPPFDPATRYRSEAARLRRVAQEAKNDRIRQQLLAMAIDYESLAESAEAVARSAAKTQA
jgi:hypothetical protein